MKDVLKKLIADNPGASRDELRDAFVRLVGNDKPALETVLWEVFDELGPEGVMALLKPKNEKH